MMSVLQHLLERVPRRLRYFLLSICGGICFLTPLALWISMTAWGMRLILAVWSVAFLVLLMMVWSSPDDEI